MNGHMEPMERNAGALLHAGPAGTDSRFPREAMGQGERGGMGASTGRIDPFFENFEKKKNRASVRAGLLCAVAVMLVMSAAMGRAWAYFTTYTAAKGGYVLHMGHEETVEEDFNSWQKALRITSTSDSRPVYVRAKAFCADYDLAYSGWADQAAEDGWVYYTEVLQPGATTEPLYVQILDVPSSKADGVRNGDTFNVIVVYETTEIQYASDGSAVAPENADWNAKVDTTRRSTTLGGED